MNKRVGRPRKEVIEKSERPKSTLTTPIPYYPALKIVTGTPLAAILMVYLEVHYPAPQDSSNQRLQRVTSLPVTLDSERICADLQVNRRTLVFTLSILSVWFSGEAQRMRAHGASREFIQPEHNTHPKIKPYSVTGSRVFVRPFVIQLRRNMPRVQALLSAANLVISTPINELALKVHPENCAASAPVFSPKLQPETSRIVELLERASVLAGDRRKVRYTRLRGAIEGGIVSPEVIKRISRKSVRSQDGDAT